MAIAFKSISTASGVGGSITMSEPSGAVEGDLLIYFLVAADSAYYTQPSGWALTFDGINLAETFSYKIGYVLRSSSAPNLTWSTTPPNAYRELSVLCFSGCNPTPPVDNYSASIEDYADTVDPDEVNTDLSNTMAVAVGIINGGVGAGGWTPPSGYTVQTPNTSGTYSVAATKTMSSSGIVDPGAFGTDAAANDTWAATIILGPDPDAPPPDDSPVASLQWISGG